MYYPMPRMVKPKKGAKAVKAMSKAMTKKPVTFKMKVIKKAGKK